jgi:non-ribosomal peptide synthase protein (TIGR01720 family)
VEEKDELWQALDLREIPQEQLPWLIQERSGGYQQQLNIEKGQVMRVVWMQTGEEESHHRLLIVLHHLVVDGVSWRILLDDLELLLSTFGEGRTDLLGVKGHSYREWYNALDEVYGKSRRLLSQGDYWAKVVQGYTPLRVDNPYDGVVRKEDLGHYRVGLGIGPTRQLLQEVPEVYHTEINDLLLCALAQTFNEWSGSISFSLGLEGHGREDSIIGGMDLSRTVGWFTNIYPVLLRGDKRQKPGDWIRSVKEQLREIPDKGMGYGVLRYLHHDPRLTGRDPWDILFNYLGQLDNVVRESKWLDGAPESPGPAVSPRHVVGYKLSINSLVKEEELGVEWIYSKKHYEAETIRQLAGAYIQNLKELITHCVEQSKKGVVVHTPSDYGLGKEIGYEELDTFLNNGDSEMNNIIEF